MTGPREGPPQGWPRKVPGTKHLSCTEDGVLLTKSGKPARVFTVELQGGALHEQAAGDVHGRGRQAPHDERGEARRGGEDRRGPEDGVVEVGAGMRVEEGRREGLEGQDARGDEGGPEPQAPRDGDGVQVGLPVREVPEREPRADRGLQGSRDAALDGREPVHRRRDAAYLADILFERLEGLLAVDTADTELVAAECMLTKAVNDTAGNVIALADSATKAAMLRSNLTGSIDVPPFYLTEEVER